MAGKKRVVSRKTRAKISRALKARGRTRRRGKR